ncbi:hypothetical protein [Leclercia adecarboxylata]|uniref:hypothetical protein n=1 Tax=Leclercia adecarboxylata TaxID=83655 RepID=UPI0025503140|nr:hypothetical protein [Leclercia adecarboxylata]
MKIQQLQIAFFYDTNTPIDFDGLSYFIRQSIKGVSGIELINNHMLGMIPKDAPPEVPRLQLLSEDNKIRLQSTLQRTDFFLDVLNENDQEDVNLLMNVADKLFEVHMQLTKRITRVGIVAYKRDFIDEPGKVIAKKYLNLVSVGGADDIVDANVMYNKPFVMEGQRFNCHIFHSAGFDEEKQRGVLLRQVDVSTDVCHDFLEKHSKEVMKKAFLIKVAEY